MFSATPHNAKVNDVTIVAFAEQLAKSSMGHTGSMDVADCGGSPQRFGQGSSKCIPRRI